MFEVVTRQRVLSVVSSITDSWISGGWLTPAAAMELDRWATRAGAIKTWTMTMRALHEGGGEQVTQLRRPSRGVMMTEAPPRTNTADRVEQICMHASGEVKC